MYVTVKFTRDSVCMGDDCFDNSRDFDFKELDSWEKIMPVILKNQFLAQVSGYNVVWVLSNHKGEEIVSYFTLKNKIIKCNKAMNIEQICNGKYELHFKYFSSPEKRGEFIYKINNGSEYNIWHEGWLEEYKLCKGID